MKHVCKITHKSQSTCILRSIHANFLQLLRNGALRACICRRHGPNFEHFSPSSSVPLVPVVPPWSAERVLKARKISPHISVAHRRFPFAFQATFRAFARVPRIYLQHKDISAVKSFREACLPPPLISPSRACGCWLCTARLSASGSGNFTDDAKRTEGLLTDTERQHVHDIVS